MERESMPYDVVVVGAGPAGLATAIRLRQRALEAGSDLSVCVVEKGAEVGAHILSGAVFEPRALDELLPDWRDTGAPLETPATDDRFLWLTASRAIPMPTPPRMKNEGNYIISLGNLCRWLAERAEALGVEIYPGFAAAEVLYDDQGRVHGIATGDMGLKQDGTPGPQHEPGVELHARQTVFAEGCRGSLAQEVMRRFDLRAGCDPQTYGIGIKELWEVPDAAHRPGRVEHTIGWPLPDDTYGGSFIYHMADNQVAVGLVIGLDYSNPYLDPYQEMQRFKTHPAVRGTFENGRRIAYGARALNEGGYQAVPQLAFPGGVLVGCAAGFLDVPRIKGSHTAIKSGITAADAVFAALSPDETAGDRATVSAYPESLRGTWLWDDLYRARNVRPAFRRGLWPGLVHAAVDAYVFRGRAPWTLRHKHHDHATLKTRKAATPIPYPKADGILTFDRLTSVQLANTTHREDEPVHLRLEDPDVPVSYNLARHDGPEQRYCPAGVYEFVAGEDGGQRLQINAQNCVHCKTCDIKDPTQNITWTVPEGGGGPAYPGM